MRTSTPPGPKGAQDQAIGRSRGGLTTKLHLAVRGLDCPVRIVLSAGQAGDAPRAQRLLEGRSAEAVIDYNADHVRHAVAAKGAEAVFPSSPARARRLPLDKHLYKERHLVECCIGKLKQFRRVSTRHEKTARNYLAAVTPAAIVHWLPACFERRRTAEFRTSAQTFEAHLIGFWRKCVPKPGR